MKDYKFPIKKLTLEILYEALSLYRSRGMHPMSPEAKVKLYGSVGKKLAEAEGDSSKVYDAVLSLSIEEMAQYEVAFKKVKTDIEITIARILLLLKKLEGKHDEEMVEDLFKELFN